MRRVPSSLLKRLSQIVMQFPGKVDGRGKANLDSQFFRLSTKTRKLVPPDKADDVLERSIDRHSRQEHTLNNLGFGKFSQFFFLIAHRCLRLTRLRTGKHFPLALIFIQFVVTDFSAVRS